MTNIYLGAYWTEHQITAQEFIHLFKGFFAKLEKLHPFFEDWYYFDENNVSYVSVNSIDHTFLEHLHIPDNWYYKPDGTKSTKISASVTSQLGFLAEFHNANDLEATASMNVGLYSGQTEIQQVVNSVRLTFPEEEDTGLLNIDMMKNILQIVAEYWSVTVAFVEAKKGSDTSVKWLTCVNHVEKLNLNFKGVEVEEGTGLHGSFIYLNDFDDQVTTVHLEEFLNQHKFLPASW